VGETRRIEVCGEQALREGGTQAPLYMTMNNEAMWQGLVWDLYKEHIRKFSHAMVKGMPSEEEMKATVIQILPESTVKVLAQERVGMVVQFHLMAIYPASEVAEVAVSEIKNFLAHRFGGGKFKLNLYHGINFLSTKNFETEGPPLWKDFVGKVEDTSL
jgi:hypothetical protein